MPNSINRRTFIKTASVIAGASMLPDQVFGALRSAMPPIAGADAEPKFKGISIHIGVNRVEPAYYGGLRFPELVAAENDAAEMHGLAQGAGFEAFPPILSESATRDRVIGRIELAAKYLAPGGILFISYSGHGMSLPDDSGDENETVPGDKQDEAWVLYDGPLVDDQIYSLWKNFDSVPNARILVVSDSCFSGTISQLISPGLKAADSKKSDPFEFQIKAISEEAAKSVYDANRSYFEAIQREFGKAEITRLKSQLLLLSACQDGQEGQYATDGPMLSWFTACLLKVWNRGKFVGNYQEFLQEIALNLQPHVPPSIQRPNCFPNTSRLGVSQTPFQI
jgi:hypothetical protein